MIKIRHFDYILWDCFGQFVYCIKDDDDQKFFLNFTNMTNWLTCNEINFRYLLVNRSNSFVKLHLEFDVYAYQYYIECRPPHSGPENFSISFLKWNQNRKSADFTKKWKDFAFEIQNFSLIWLKNPFKERHFDVWIIEIGWSWRIFFGDNQSDWNYNNDFATFFSSFSCLWQCFNTLTLSQSIWIGFTFKNFTLIGITGHISHDETHDRQILRGCQITFTDKFRQIGWNFWGFNVTKTSIFSTQKILLFECFYLLFMIAQFKVKWKSHEFYN